jgi:hypothetical protein
VEQCGSTKIDIYVDQCGSTELLATVLNGSHWCPVVRQTAPRIDLSRYYHTAPRIDLSRYYHTAPRTDLSRYYNTAPRVDLSRYYHTDYLLEGLGWKNIIASGMH